MKWWQGFKNRRSNPISRVSCSTKWTTSKILTQPCLSEKHRVFQEHVVGQPVLCSQYILYILKIQNSILNIYKIYFINDIMQLWLLTYLGDVDCVPIKISTIHFIFFYFIESQLVNKTTFTKLNFIAAKHSLYGWFMWTHYTHMWFHLKLIYVL